jgi:hypothetical protein
MSNLSTSANKIAESTSIIKPEKMKIVEEKKKILNGLKLRPKDVVTTTDGTMTFLIGQRKKSILLGPNFFRKIRSGFPGNSENFDEAVQYILSTRKKMQDESKSTLYLKVKKNKS